jgi:hypothetical protein
MNYVHLLSGSITEVAQVFSLAPTHIATPKSDEKHVNSSANGHSQKGQMRETEAEFPTSSKDWVTACPRFAFICRLARLSEKANSMELSAG